MHDFTSSPPAPRRDPHSIPEPFVFLAFPLFCPLLYYCCFSFRAVDFLCFISLFSHPWLQISVFIFFQPIITVRLPIRLAGGSFPGIWKACPRRAGFSADWSLLCSIFKNLSNCFRLTKHITHFWRLIRAPWKTVHSWVWSWPFRSCQSRWLPA